MKTVIMRRLTTPKINCFYVHYWLLFLPSSTSALLVVFLAGLTFGFLHFPVFIFLIFPFLLFLFFLFLIIVLLIVNFLSFIFIYLLFFIVWPHLRSYLVPIALLSSWLSLMMCLSFALFQLLPICKLYVFLSSLCSPLYQFLLFSVVFIWIFFLR